MATKIFIGGSSPIDVEGETYYGWYDNANWSPAGIPNLNGTDDVVLDGNSPNFHVNYQDMVCKNFDSTNYTNKIAFGHGIWIFGTSCIFGNQVQFSGSGLVLLEPAYGDVTLTINERESGYLQFSVVNIFAFYNVNIVGDFYANEIGCVYAGNVTAGNIILTPDPDDSMGISWYSGKGTQAAGKFICNNITAGPGLSWYFYHGVYFDFDIGSELDVLQKMTLSGYSRFFTNMYEEGDDIGGAINIEDLEFLAGSHVWILNSQTVNVLGTFTAKGTAINPIIFTVHEDMPPYTTRAFFPVANVGEVSYVQATEIDSSGGETVIDHHGTLDDTVNWKVDYLALLSSSDEFLKSELNNAFDVTIDVSPIPNPVIDSDGSVSRMTTSVCGLNHLEGKTVTILADGKVVSQKQVMDGCVSLGKSYAKAHAGIPYTADMETLNMEMALPNGTMQGRKVKVSQLILRLLSSRGGHIGPDSDTLHPINYSNDLTQGDLLKLISGDVKENLGAGYEDGGHIFLRQADPLPMSLLVLIPSITPGGVTNE